jgi:hypothetical protein
MIGHVFFGIFILILSFLVLSHWQAAQTIITTGGNTANQYTKTLQGNS